jgi:hypothetical protein
MKSELTQAIVAASPTKERFDKDTIEVMNQIAILLAVSQLLRQMAKTFVNNANLAERKEDEGNPRAKKILGFTRRTATDMLHVVFGPKDKRASRILVIQTAAARKLPSVLLAAQELSRMERDELNVDPVIAAQVWKPLNQLYEAWK